MSVERCLQSGIMGVVAIVRQPPVRLIFSFSFIYDMFTDFADLFPQLTEQANK